MSSRIILSWTVSVENTSFGPAEAETAIGAVDLYVDENTDPVLGQLFGLTVADDTTSSDATTATRTLTLNMDATQGAPTAPPPFPCHPNTSTPPVLPYALQKAVTLPGSFFVTNGLMNVPTTASQIPSLVTGSTIQFLAQEGVLYEVATVGPTSINLTAPYTGTTKNSGAFKEISDPATLPAIYSTSDLDTNGVATDPAIPAGSGARTVSITYADSTGAGPFTVVTSLTGRRPAAIALAGGSIDIALITALKVASVGGFENSIGQITLVDLSSELPAIPPNATPGTGIGVVEGDNTFFALTAAAQLLIDRTLAYLPPSYFALAQQSLSAPELEGDFIVTTGSKDVPTTEDQTGTLAAGNTIQFAVQPSTVYTIAAVTDRIVKLTEEFSGLDTNNTGEHNPNSNLGTQGNLGSELLGKPTGGRRVSTSPSLPPNSAQLSAPLGQFLETQVAAPPPSPPLSPSTVPAPTPLSGLFTRTLQLALKGAPVIANPITFT